MRNWSSTGFVLKDKNDQYPNCFDYYIIEKIEYDGITKYNILNSNCSGGSYICINNTYSLDKKGIGYSSYTFSERSSLYLHYYNADKEKIQDRVKKM